MSEASISGLATTPASQTKRKASARGKPGDPEGDRGAAASSAQASEAGNSGLADTSTPPIGQGVSAHGSADVAEAVPSAERPELAEQKGVRSAVLTEQMAEERCQFRQNEQGVRGNPEPHTLVNKVCAAEGKGELWLSGVPVARTLPRFQQLGISLQVSCLQAHPEDEGPSHVR